MRTWHQKQAIRRTMLAGALAAALVVSVVAPSGAQEATTHKVKVGDNFFKPKKLSITAGDTIKWKWTGTAIHDVVAKKPSPEKFKSDKQASGKFTHTFLEPGKYKIVCTLHPGMDMKVIVAIPAEPTTTTTTAPAP